MRYHARMRTTQSGARAWLVPLVVRPLFFAVPFAIFFSYLNGEGLATLPAYYVVSVIFTLVISLFVEANRHWIAPRFAARSGEPGPPRALQVLSFGVAAILGSVVAAIVLHYTIAPGTFGSERAIVLLLLFAIFFSALFLGVIYARRMQRLYVKRVREEAERTAREEQELRLAGEIQQALLPPRLYTRGALTAAGASIPCRAIGGDFFEYVDLPGDRAGFALGDVAGKGPSAAILAALVQGIFMSEVEEGGGPAATMARVNRALRRRAVETRFVTIVYAILDGRGALVSCTAGQNHPFWVARDGSVRRLERGGLLLGAFDEAAYEEEAYRLAPGDTIVAFSDGVCDAENASGEQFGEDRLRALILEQDRDGAPEVLLDRVLRGVQAFIGNHPQADDITLLVVRYAGP